MQCTKERWCASSHLLPFLLSAVILRNRLCMLSAMRRTVTTIGALLLGANVALTALDCALLRDAIGKGILNTQLVVYKHRNGTWCFRQRTVPTASWVLMRLSVAPAALDCALLDITVGGGSGAHANVCVTE